MSERKHKKGDTLQAVIVFVSLAMALATASLPASIIFAVVMAEDCFTRWLDLRVDARTKMER